MGDKRKIDYDDPRYRTTPFQQMASSCTGALITSVFVTPLDVIKIRLQSQQRVNTKSKCFLYCNGLMDHLCSCTNPQDWYRRPSHFNGTIDAFVKITRNEGILSLWSGLGPTLVLALPTTVLYFVTYEQLRYRIKDWYNKRNKNVQAKQPFWIPISCGATARTIAVTTVSPLELIRTKMQSERLSYKEVGGVLSKLVKANGVHSLWRGIVPTLLRDVPFSAIYWVSYESLKSLSSNPTFYHTFVYGACAGAAAATVTIPFDVVKTRQQIDLGDKEIFTDKPNRAKTTMDVIKEIYKGYGIRGLFAGLVPRIAKVAPACAIMISTFEYSKQRGALIKIVKERHLTL